MNKSIQIILYILYASVLGKAQIPNYNFETWTTTNGYETPDNWNNLNSLTYSSGIYTCLKGTPGYSGTAYLYLISKTIPGKGVVPGIAICGEIDTITYKPKSGFPFSNRPQNLGYYIQFMPYDQTDSSCVTVLLTKWNQLQFKRDTIAYGASYFYSMVHTWLYADTYLNYMSGSNPDSAIIVISSSSSFPKDGSYIYIDNLQFTGNVIGIDETYLNSSSVLIIPNPSSETITVKIDSNEEFPMELSIYDSVGKLMSKSMLSDKSNTQNISNWSKGIYTVQLKGKKSTLTKKLIIN